MYWLKINWKKCSRTVCNNHSLPMFFSNALFGRYLCMITFGFHSRCPRTVAIHCHQFHWFLVKVTHIAYIEKAAFPLLIFCNFSLLKDSRRQYRIAIIISFLYKAYFCCFSHYPLLQSEVSVKLKPYKLTLKTVKSVSRGVMDKSNRNVTTVRLYSLCFFNLLQLIHHALDIKFPDAFTPLSP